MAQWDDLDPGRADLDEVHRRIVRLRDHGEHAAALGTALPRTADATSDFWRGDAQIAWCERVQEASHAWRMLHHWADAETVILRRYAAAVESIRERAAVHRALLTTARGEVDTAGDEASLDLAQLSLDASARALAALAQERREADAVLARDVDELRLSCVPVRPTRLPTRAALRAMTPSQLLDEMADLSPQDLEKLLGRDPGVVSQLEHADPAQVAAWWAALDNPQSLIDLVPAVIGALDGVPPAARVAANRLIAQQRLDDDRFDLLALAVTEGVAGPTRGGRLKAERIEREMAYLRRVEAGEVQLYLYDPDASRIVEMIGTPSAATKNVITYVPGTFTSLDSFSKGDVQKVAQYLLAGSKDDRVAFVYKDGRFPGENDTTGEVTMPRILEANSQTIAQKAGKRLSGFETGLDAIGLGGADRVAVGHSWGVADITSSEMNGTHFDRVISLSGAWTPPGWQPNARTRYTDLSYDDILQKAGPLGLLSGTPPRDSPGFNAVPYFTGPKGMSLSELHSLVADVDASGRNDVVLRALKRKSFR